MSHRTQSALRHHSGFDVIPLAVDARVDRGLSCIERTRGVDSDLVGTRRDRAWPCIVWRARLAAFLAMSLALLAATQAPSSSAALDPAASWRALLTAAGCPPGLAHDLAIRIERLAGPPPGPNEDVAVTAAQRAEQIRHLVVGRHGLQLTPAQIDAALAALIGAPASSGRSSHVMHGPPVDADAASLAQATPEPLHPFTTRHAVDQLREWLPTAAPP